MEIDRNDGTDRTAVLVALFLIVLALFIAPAALKSQTIRQGPDLQFFSTPGYVGTGTSNVITKDFYLDLLTLSNVTTGDLTCTVMDRAGSPLPLLKDTLVPANSVYVMPTYGRFMPGGVSWSCSAANSVVGYLHGRY